MGVLMCANCGKDFVVSDNNSKACRYHPGRWASRPIFGGAGKHSPKRMARNGSSPTLAHVGAAIMTGPGVAPDSPSGVGFNEDRQWSCCGSTDPKDPGCTISAHV